MAPEEDDARLEPILDIMARELPVIEVLQEFLSFLAKDGFGIVNEQEHMDRSPWARMEHDPVWWWLQMRDFEQVLLNDEILALVQQRERERLEYEDE